jgi:hypothetical protein
MAARESELREASSGGCLSGRDEHARRKLSRESSVVRRYGSTLEGIDV